MLFTFGTAYAQKKTIANGDDVVYGLFCCFSSFKSIIKEILIYYKSIISISKASGKASSFQIKYNKKTLCSSQLCEEFLLYLSYPCDNIILYSFFVVFVQDFVAVSSVFFEVYFIHSVRLVDFNQLFDACSV